MSAQADTGAGFSYLLTGGEGTKGSGHTTFKGIKRIVANFTVKMAGGERQRITEGLQGSFSLAQKTTFYILKVKGKVCRPTILLGLREMKSLLLWFNIGFIPYIGDKELYLKDRDSADTAVNAVQHTLDQEMREFIKNGLAAMVEIPKPEKEKEPVRGELSEAEHLRISGFIQGLVQEGASAMLSAPDYLLGFKELGEEAPDSEIQTHYPELHLPELALSGRSGRIFPDFSRRAVEGLTEEERADFKTKVKEYLDLKWWTEATPEEEASGGNIRNTVFYIPEGARKRARLVCDLRPINDRLPKATSFGACPGEIIPSLRLGGESSFATIDASSAFYRVRLNKDLILRVGGQSLKTKRMAFGLGVGPGGLQASLGKTLEKLQGSSLLKCAGETESFLYLYVDDYGIGIDDGALLGKWLATILQVMGHLGWDVSRKKALVIAKDKASVDSGLAEYKLGMQCTEELDYLSARLSYKENFLKARCSIEGKLNEIIAELERLHSGQIKWSKKRAFGIAGMVAYDVLGVHARRRACGDVIRAVYGKQQKVSWEEKLSTLEGEGLPEALRYVVQWLLTDLKEAAHKGCAHYSPVKECLREANGEKAEPDTSQQAWFGTGKNERSTTRLILTTDACDVAGGYSYGIWYKGEYYCLGEGICRFKNAGLGWHSNRKEALCLLKGLIAVSRVIETLYVARGKRKLNLELWAFSDNVATVAWADQRGGLRKHDQRAIERIRVSINEELCHLRKITGGLTIKHIKGEDNGIADQLSRWYAEELTLPDGKTIMLGEAISDRRVPEIGEDPEEEEMEKEHTEEADDEIFLITEDYADLVKIKGREPEEVVEDTICMLKNESSNELSNEGLLERISRGCNNMDHVLDTFAVCRYVFHKWRYRKEEGAEPSEDTLEKSGIRETSMLAQAAQQADQRTCHQLYHGFQDGAHHLTYDPEQRCLIHFASAPGSGVFVKREVYIPRSCTRFLRILATTAHHRAAHQGGDTSFEFREEFYSHGLRTLMHKVVKNCLYCRKLRATCVWEKKVEGDGLEEKRNEEEWVKSGISTIGIDVLVLGKGRKALTVTDYYSKYVAMRLIQRETTEEVIRALKQVLGGFPKRISRIHCDRGVYFTSDLFKTFCEGRGIQVSYIAAAAHWEGGFFERSHRTILAILRVKLDRERAVDILDSTDFELQEILEEICFLLNTRPLGKSTKGDCPYTPKFLVSGDYGNGGILGGICEGKACDEGLQHWEYEGKMREVLWSVRREYLDTLWVKMRKRVIQNYNRKAKEGTATHLAAGDPVLVYRQKSKEQLHLQLGHVKQIGKEHQKSVEVVLPKGRIMRVNRQNLISVAELRESYYDSSLDGAVPGRELYVRIADQSGSKEWYRGIVQSVLGPTGTEGVEVSWKESRHAPITSTEKLNLANEQFHWGD